MATSPQDRSLWAAMADRLAGWYLGLSAETCSYTSQAVRIPMRDGVELAADLYQPVVTGTARPSGLLLVQSCYGRGEAMAIFNARLYAARGYQVLFVSSRGTFGSGGQFDPGRNEQTDGQDVVVWMREQPWYPGSFATAGASYLGYSQWALLHDPPEDCVAAVISAGMHDLGRQSWGSGSLMLQRIVWSDLIAHQEDPGIGFLARMWAMVTTTETRRLRPVLEGLPLIDHVQAHFAGRAPWIEDVMTRPDLSDPYWAPTQHGAALERVKIPTLLVNGWYDLFSRQSQTFDEYRRLKERGCPVGLTVGPWDHVEASGLKTLPDIMGFLDSHVARNKAQDPFRARIFVTGAQEWREMDSWPPATVPFVTYLHGDGTLGSAGMPADVASSSFTYDPADPTPTVEPGKDDKGVLAGRSDVLVYTSGPLKSDMEVMGQPVVQLAHSSDIPFVDLVVRLSELDPATGVSRSITEKFQALDPTRDSTPLRLTLSDCAHRFQKGRCIRLTVAGGSFPLYARNLGTEGNRVLGATTRPSCHTISYSAGLSYLTLPKDETYHD
ncbi:CocE/NonD hydrolase [Coniochaeta ligniaria NRRL 30616]|uniref:CocE/NonD hydrolase n=1 Tax=Coniochaeta ligniaria NRRL 30616 TaxID=1408157 RepID=A0A1J7I4X8_9PEZI|nr:CocE/NonD hydrolase [Coniochaeta ligniaria NRRL 30616]